MALSSIFYCHRNYTTQPLSQTFLFSSYSHRNCISLLRMNQTLNRATLSVLRSILSYICVFCRMFAVRCVRAESFFVLLTQCYFLLLHIVVVIVFCWFFSLYSLELVYVCCVFAIMQHIAHPFN